MAGLLPPEEAANVDQEAFRDGHVLTIGEVSNLLDMYLRARTNQNEKFQMPAVVKKTKAYTDRFRQIKTGDASQRVREMLLSKGLREYEFAILVNLMPDTAEEAYVLVPSLKDPARFSEEAITEMLENLASYREFQ